MRSPVWAPAPGAAKLASYLEAVGIAGRDGHLPHQLSGGERQRVAIARALANHPRLLLADEPTGNLDEESASIVMDLLENLRVERGVTLLVVTHNPAVVARAGSRLALARGRTVGATPDAPHHRGADRPLVP